MADQTLSEQAARRDDATFKAQVGAALDREILDITKRTGAWSGEDADKATDKARALLGSSVERAEVLDACVRIAAADLVGVTANPTEAAIRRAVRRALRFSVKLSQEA